MANPLQIDIRILQPLNIIGPHEKKALGKLPLSNRGGQNATAMDEALKDSCIFADDLVNVSVDVYPQAQKKSNDEYEYHLEAFVFAKIALDRKRVSYLMQDRFTGDILEVDSEGDVWLCIPKPHSF